MRSLPLFLLLLGGCANWVETSPAVFGPFPNRSEAELFEDVRTTVVARNYVPIDADPVLGHFAVRTRARGPEGRATIRFRFYRGGWIGTEIGGGGIRRGPDGRMGMPRPIFDEYTQLVVGLLGRRER